MFKLYDFSISLLVFGMKIASLFHEKTKKGYLGRKESLTKVKKEFSPEDRVIWMHAASLGEYEQGLPVLEKLKIRHPEYKILITFFSPSGYENVVRKKNIADVICYLPFDKRKGIKEFCNQFATEIFFTVKYDYWYRLLQNLAAKNTPVYVVSALFYKEQSFFRFWGKFFVNRLKENVTLFFHQTKTSLNLAKSIGLEQSILAGDTRFERVKKNKENFTEINEIKEFVQDFPVLVVGSSWEAEENIVKKFIDKNSEARIILAPHDLKRVPQIKNRFQDAAVLFSQFSLSEMQKTDRILIVDNIGMLSKLYHYAHVALVGGGFHQAGLHNILEAAVYGVPVLFGNHYKKNPEADELIAQNGAKSFSNEEEATTFLLQLFQEPEMQRKMSENAAQFIQKQPNASEIILENMLN